MKRTIATFSLAALLLGPTLVPAHEGKGHSRIAGTVDDVEDGSFQLETATGKIVSIYIDEDTEFRDAEGAVSHGSPRVGDRVVVRAMGGDRLTGGRSALRGC